MEKRLFIIGNGFDLAHHLPTSIKNDFKKIAKSNESNENFWELYQPENSDFWSDFENSLAHPDFNSLLEILNPYTPDFTSDHESDRDAIITQVDISGNLYRSLEEFAKKADEDLRKVLPLDIYKNFFNKDDYFISFNYTHTLEKIYKIDKKSILHIHGENGKNNLILGYPQGNFKPEDFYFDITRKDRFLQKWKFDKWIKKMEEDDSIDFYTITAYKNLFNKVKSFSKGFQEEILSDFLSGKEIYEVHILGHSCGIDFEYFIYLKEKYPNAIWFFHNPYNKKTLKNVKRLINNIKLDKYRITYSK